MDFWSTYQSRGIWGMWCDYFSRQKVDFDLRITADSFDMVLSAASLEVRAWGDSGARAVFRWVASPGLEVEILGSGVVEPTDAQTWRLLLEYESRLVESAPTFMPVMPPVGPLAAELNALMVSPPQVVLLNGQPGTGKGAVLQGLALLHAHSVIASREEPLTALDMPGGPIFLAPEVAMLEPAQQQTLVKHAKAGARVWTATVYDVQMLKSRKILSGALVDLLEDAKRLLPPLAKRDPAELKKLAAFWQSFHGIEKKRVIANLDFHKRRALGLDALSVESILEEGRGLRGVIAEFERDAILKAHSRVGRSQHKIARLLKVSRGSLQHKLRKYQLESYTAPDADTEDSG